MAYRNTVTITVYTSEPLSESEYSDEAEGFPFLNDVIYQMTYGDAVGDYELGEPEKVEGEALREGLVAIGNDGTFFDGEDDLDD